MIKEVTYYDFICDRCGKSLTEESEMSYTDTESAEMVAKDSEWEKIGGKQYCSDCYKLDEETDEYVPKKTMSKTIYCGECDNFLYEDTYGYGVCEKSKEGCLCSDKCHLTNGNP